MMWKKPNVVGTLVLSNVWAQMGILLLNQPSAHVQRGLYNIVVCLCVCAGIIPYLRGWDTPRVYGIFMAYPRYHKYVNLRKPSRVCGRQREAAVVKFQPTLRYWGPDDNRSALFLTSSMLRHLLDSMHTERFQSKLVISLVAFVICSVYNLWSTTVRCLWEIIYTPTKAYLCLSVILNSL